jgi:serine protease AprX
VRVAVVDTGVSDTAALDRASGRLVDAYDSTGAGGPLVDGYGHGTFMATVLAGGPVDRGAPVGVAPGATVLVVRVAAPDGSTSLSSVLGGLDWVAAHPGQVDVASLSFSHARPGEGYGPDPLTNAVEAVRDAGVTVVVSAGNTAGVVGDPGFTPRALTVGAADLTGKNASVAGFSGSARVAGVDKPDVVANGVSVLGLLPPASVIARGNPTSRSGALWRGTGTSQATAVTSGVAALLLAKRPDASPAQVKAALRSAARPLAGSRDGAGLLRVTTSTSRGGGTSDGPPSGGGDASGEAGFDANSWSANSWSANSWSANSWSANSWSANSWSANSWSWLDRDGR